jgi:hypothetical protein
VVLEVELVPKELLVDQQHLGKVILVAQDYQIIVVLIQAAVEVVQVQLALRVHLRLQGQVAMEYIHS